MAPTIHINTPLFNLYFFVICVELLSIVIINPGIILFHYEEDQHVESF